MKLTVVAISVPGMAVELLWEPGWFRRLLGMTPHTRTFWRKDSGGWDDVSTLGREPASREEAWTCEAAWRAAGGRPR